MKTKTPRTPKEIFVDLKVKGYESVFFKDGSFEINLIQGQWLNDVELYRISKEGYKLTSVYVSISTTSVHFEPDRQRKAFNKYLVVE